MWFGCWQEVSGLDSVGTDVRILCVSLIISALVGCTSSPSPSVDVGPPRPTAAYSVFPGTVRFGGTPEATLRNEGQVPLEYENEYVLEMLIDGEWTSFDRPPDARGACDFPSLSLLLHPAESKSQKIIGCDLHGEIRALAPGQYRVTKVVRTVASEPGKTPVEITKVAEFEVTQPVVDIPKSSRCRVLCVSDTRAEPGQTLTVSFDPPRRFIWGVGSELHAGTAQTLTPVAFLYGWHGREQMKTLWPEAQFGYEDVGFQGPSEWQWLVPRRLEPGIYSLVKEGSTGVPLEQERTWTVTFEVGAVEDR